MKKLLIFSLVPLLACGQEGLKVTPSDSPAAGCEQLPKGDLLMLDRFAYRGPQTDEDRLWSDPRERNGGDSMMSFDPAERAKTWTDVHSARCLREALLEGPRCSAETLRKGNGSCRRVMSPLEWGWSVERIQLDQQDCSLKSLYEEYKQHAHSPEEVAAQCVGFVALDPEMGFCLEENKKTLKRLAKTAYLKPYETNPVFSLQLLQFTNYAALWDSSYDQVFDWLMKNYYTWIPNWGEKKYGPVSKIRLDLIAAYRQQDRESVLRLVAEASKKGWYLPEAYPLLHKLGFQGDEYERLKKLGTAEKYLWSYAPENHDKMVKDGYGPPDYPKLKPNICAFREPFAKKP